MASKIIIHAPHNSTPKVNRELSWKIADLHYGGSDGKQPHKNGSTQQEAHGKKGSRSPYSGSAKKEIKSGLYERMANFKTFSAGDEEVVVYSDTAEGVFGAMSRFGYNNEEAFAEDFGVDAKALVGKYWGIENNTVVFYDESELIEDVDVMGEYKPPAKKKSKKMSKTDKEYWDFLHGK